MANGSSYTLNIKALFDASNVKAGVGEIQNSLKSLKLPDKLTTDLNSSFANVNKALDDFTSRVEKGVKSKTDASGITKSFETVTKELNKLDNLIIKVQGELGKSTDLSQIIKIPDKAKQDIADLDKQIAQLQQRINATNTDKLEKVQKAFDLIKTKGAMEHGQKALELFKSGDIEGAIEILDKIINKLNYVKQTANVVASQEGLGGMKKAIEEAQAANAKTYDEIGQKAAQQAQIVSNATAEVTGKINQEAAALHGVSEGAAQASQGITDLTARQQQFVSEVDQVKSRIQYFFGLANSINLVKRAIRGAVDTIKELDKAMTETAVVTEYTVKDMWSQLPEYTKRANQLGVTTKEAYESATLYFQQGLNNEQAAALSTETLKMARIAGLDAAEATDRMTNALRGFNMALDEQSAQRVDDVYSQLAAHTASNVDEISTAMTKVASLAHNANMEFETTAAFLAQIIETTRESAETAGTALKTVVARFSEVKKLVDEGTLKGTDEEGQAIDVNKVGAALRTAGIDLNKYFLGEVGLDDIFIELASKWDSLTAVQQRYIATQAAGSRQQSRFIALMQDYARTQELVGMAYDAEGASEKQFEKTQDSLQSKLARLKNAWNEFLMGITNNGMVKGFVDILTTILNIVNKITSAFGDGLGGVLKFAAAFGTIMGARSLFSNGGFATQAIGNFLDKSPLANKFRVNAGLGVFETEENGGYRYRPYTREELKGRRTSFFGTGGLFSGWKEKAQKFKEANLGSTSAAYRQYEQMSRDYLEVNPGAENPFAEEMVLYGTPKTLFGALGNKFKGTKIGGALAAKLGGSAGAAGVSGAATLAAGLGIVTTAAIAAAAAIKTVYDFSPQGQLKNAQKLADSMSDVAAAAKQTASQLKKTKEENEEYTQAIADSTTASGRTEAIQNRNEYIQSLLEQDATYAKYLSSTFENGQLILTLDEDALATAADKAAEAATQAAVGASFAQATVAGREATLYNSRIRNAGVDINARTIRDYDTEGNAFYRQMTDNEYAKYAKMASDAQAAQAQMQNYAKQAYSQLIDADALGDELAEELASAMSKTFDSRELDTANWSFLRSRGYWENEYLGVYGQEADKNLKTADIARAVKQGQQTQEKATAVDTLTELLTGPQADLYRSALDAFEGIGEAAEINFDKLGENFSAEDVLNQLGLQTNGELDTLNQLAPLATALGTDITTLRKTIVDQAKLNKEVQKQNKANIYSTALANGISLPIDSKFVTDVAALSPKMAKVISNIATSAVDSLSQEGMAQLLPQLLGMTEENLAQFNDFFAGFDLNDPINAFHKLNQAKEEALSLPEDDFGNAYRQMLSDIEQTNASIFDTGNLVQTFLTSTSYDSLTSSIEDFIKANGKLTADNIEELADSCSDLQNLLEDTTATAQGLAAAFSLFENGEAPIDALTSSLIAALSAGEDFETLMSNVSKWIEDFDEGTDLKEGTEHVAELAEKATDYIYNWEFGNEPLANIYDHIFGKNAYETYMKENWGKTPIEEIETKLQGDIDRVKSLAENAGRNALDELINNPLAGGLKGGITNLGNGEYTWDLDAYANANDAITDIAKNLGVADDAARAFIESWGSHMWDMGQAWNELNFNDKIKAFSDDLGQNNIITQQELDVLAKNTGKTSEEIITAINNLRDKTGKPLTISVDWTNGKGQNLSGDDLLKEVNNVLNQLGSSYDKLAEKFGTKRSGLTDLGTYGLTDLGINYQNLSNYLTDSLKLSDSQAKEVANNIASETGKNLTQDIQVPIRLDDGSIELQTKTIAAKTAEELQSKIDATQLQAQFDNLAKTLLDTFTNVPEVEITYNEVNRPDPIPSQTVYITYKELNKPSGTGRGTTRAAGGIVESYAKGSENFHVKPGTALTGEEGPEIVWNKEKGYAYVTGSDGPEFQDLKPGDRVFNASETKKIFKNSSAANGGKVDSLADPQGSWNDRLPRNDKNGAAKEKEKTSDEWKNELDWLYNLMEDIVELERDQKKFEEEFEDILTDDAKTSKDLYNLLIQRLGNLNVQLDRQTFALQKREQEMREFMDTTNDQDQYLWYNWSDRTLEIDWDAIDKIVDGELYKHVKDLISEAEEIQGKMDDAEDAIQDIKNQIQELENIWRDTYVDFEKRVLDALVKSYQQVIDNYSTLNDTINNSNNEILEAIQNEIDLQRQIRDNTETESDIADKEARLAYLQRDTTGANAQEILQLQKELDTNRQDYEDSLIDQAIQRLQDDNDEAAKQRNKQIEIMQAQLDYQKENGEFNDYISDLISNALSPDGTLLTTSELYELLNEQENWEAMSATNKQIWEEELKTTFKEVGAYLLKTYADWNGEFYRQVAESINAINEQYQINVGSYSQAQAGGSSGSGSGGGGGGGNGSGNGGNTNTGSGETWVRTGTYTYDGDSSGHWQVFLEENTKTGAHRTTADMSTKSAHVWGSPTIESGYYYYTCTVCGYRRKGASIKPSQQEQSTTNVGAFGADIKKTGGNKNKKYATGGLNTRTGLAWLDGTPSEPEYVLNARQTQAFLKLADVLPAAMNGNAPISNSYGGDIYLNLDMHVDEIADDYDVDRIANRVKDIIYDASSYRNVNTINFIR